VQQANPTLLSEYLSTQQLCAELGIHERTLRLWTKAGIAPPRVPLGNKRILYRRSSVAAWLASREATGASR